MRQETKDSSTARKRSRDEGREKTLKVCCRIEGLRGGEEGTSHLAEILKHRCKKTAAGLYRHEGVIKRQGNGVLCFRNEENERLEVRRETRRGAKGATGEEPSAPVCLSVGWGDEDEAVENGERSCWTINFPWLIRKGGEETRGPCADTTLPFPLVACPRR